MEAAGVGRAVKRLLPSAEFIAIKGISDLADETRTLLVKKSKQEIERPPLPTQRDVWLNSCATLR
jgi:hypothetical protein